MSTDVHKNRGWKELELKVMMKVFKVGLILDFS